MKALHRTLRFVDCLEDRDLLAEPEFLQSAAASAHERQHGADSIGECGGLLGR
jgi:hypothetical protein